MIKFFCVFFIGVCSLTFGVIPYTVDYVGVDNPTALKTIKSITQLNTLKKRPPDSIYALRYRAESDIPEILKVLHSHGYYEATVLVTVEEQATNAKVIVNVNPGPAYKISSFSIYLFESCKDNCVSCPSLTANTLGLVIGKQIEAAEVINAELKALQNLSECGYPLARISNRSFIADGDTKTVKIHLEIDSGPLSFFGPISITGNTSIRPLFFDERLLIQKGDVYSGSTVEKTHKNLMDSGLFSSILITHAETPNEKGELPIHVEVAESKHKSIYGGVSYQTYYGPGLTFGWENRNIGQMGKRLTLQGDITKRSHSGIATFLQPNFLAIGQDYVWQAQAIHLDILPFSERSYHLITRLEKKFSEKMRISFGLEGEKLFVTSSVQDGDYWILEVPIFLALNLSNSLLNPTKGFNFEYKTIPTFTFLSNRSFFLGQEGSLSYYLPLDKKHIFTIAQKITLGSIISGGDGSVPVPKRFFGGSEDDLRGYAYYSVSPLNHNGKPEGGRSAIFYTLETRIRYSKTLGFVPFFDMGNVSKKTLFVPEEKWLKSVGLGIRYFSFVGPFRLDVGFPLNPRKNIDKKYRILISVGQAF